MTISSLTSTSTEIQFTFNWQGTSGYTAWVNTRSNRMKIFAPDGQLLSETRMVRPTLVGADLALLQAYTTAALNIAVESV